MPGQTMIAIEQTQLGKAHLWRPGGSQPELRTVVLRLMIVLLVCLAIALTAVIMVARTATPAAVAGIPDYLLPGNPAPPNVIFESVYNGRSLYSVTNGADRVYVTLDDARIITSAL